MICSKCKEDKEQFEFYKHKKSKTGLSPWCKECQKSHKKEHYVNNKDKYIDNSFKNSLWLLELKLDKKCERCGFSHPAALDFHHTDPNEKEFGLAGRRTISEEKKKKVLDEIKKCIVLCSNCHRIEHAIHINKYIESKTK